MIDFPLIVGKAVISTCISRLTNSFFSLNEDPLYRYVSREISIHQTMIEDIYLSSLRTFSDYVDMGNYEKAADALMDISNREGTPITKYLLGMTLLKIGQKDLANKKIQEAFAANPLLSELIGISVTSLMSTPNPTSFWSVTPCTVEDSLGNKIIRRLGVEINEGVKWVEVSSFGGHIAFLESFEEKCCYGVLNIEDGTVEWMRSDEEDYDRRIALYTPEYVVYDFHGKYEIFKQSSGRCVASFSKDAFHVLFCPQEQLESSNLKPYETSFSLNYSTSPVIIQTHISKSLRIEPYVVKNHRYWKTDGNQPHPGIDFDPVEYSAMNVRFKLA